MKRLRIESELIQRILWHSDVTVTERQYIKTIREDQWAAMNDVQHEVTKKTAVPDSRSGSLDSERTVKPPSGAPTRNRKLV